MKKSNKRKRNITKFRAVLIAFLISFAFSAVICPSVSAVSAWSKTYGGTASDTAAGETVQTIDGGYAILGDTSSFGAGGSDFWLIKTDADGNMQWNKTYGGTGTETSGDMCVTADGGYALVGLTQSYGAGGQDFWLVKTGADGTAFWAKTYGGTGNEYAYHVEQTLDGGYALLGQTASFGAGGNDFWLVKTDENGNMQWNKTYGGTGSDIGIHVLQTGDGGYALLGSTTSFGTGSNDAWLIKTDALGNMLWNKTYGGTGMEFGQCIEPTSDGGYAISGITTSFGAGSMDIWLVKIDASGNVQWNQTYGGTGSDGSTHFIQTSDGGYAINGYTVGSGQDAWLVKTDALGNMEWNQKYGGTGTEISYALLETSDGGYLLTINTNSFGAGGNDIWLLKTDELGAVLDYSWDWPMFRKNVQHNGYSTGPAPETNQILWNYTTLEGMPGFDSCAAVVDGKVYAGCYDRHVYCWDVASGAQIWNYTTGGWIMSSPAVADSMVYIGGYDGRVYCLDAASGALIWNYTAGDDVWSSPAVVDGKVYVGSNDDNVYCLDALTGALIWNYTTGDDVGSSPAVVDGKVYVSSNNNVFCFDASTGAKIWKYTIGGAWSSPAVVGGNVYVGSGDSNVYCLDAASGALLWNYTTGAGIGSSPAVANGKVYVGSDDYNVYCLDATTGALIWNYTTGDGVYSSPAVADGKVYVGSLDGTLYCLDADNGALIWSYSIDGLWWSSPTIANGVVYIGSGLPDHQMYAFGTNVIPESLTLGVMLLLSTVAAIISIHYYRKRPKCQSW